MLSKYLYNSLLAFDQFVNVVFLFGDPDMSVSTRCAKALKSGNPKYFVLPLAQFIDGLFLILAGEKNHIARSYEPDELGEKELWSWEK